MDIRARHNITRSQLETGGDRIASLIRVPRLVLALALITMTQLLAAEAQTSLKATTFARIAGWSSDNHAAALATFRRSCAEILTDGRAFRRAIKFGGTREDWDGVCRRAMAAGDARKFFEAEFTPVMAGDTVRPRGLFTGYFEPEAEGSRVANPAFPVAIYGRPGDLVAFDAADEKATGLRYGRKVDGKPKPYFTRREIEEGALRGQGLEVVWLRDWADAFFIHVQGSGRVRFADGSSMRLAYAAKSGQPYTGIGGILVERGLIDRQAMSMQAIRAWMEDNPKAARNLMWENRSFVFFREVAVDDPDLGAPGAQMVQLTPGRSLAVDRSLWAFGTPVWLDTTVPGSDPETKLQFRHLMIAQDTGTAIRGALRGDVYWGWGERAIAAAGHMKSPGTMIVLLPKPLAKKLLGSP
jgi:peptidoglycan lytic transglycosylase A